MTTTITLGPLVCHDEADGSGIAEPFLWPVFFKIDQETIDELAGAPTVEGFVLAPGGRHGNLPEMDADESVVFMASASFANIVPIEANPNATTVGFVVALLEEDAVPSDELIASLYDEFVSRVRAEIIAVVPAVVAAGGAGALDGAAGAVSTAIRERLRAEFEEGVWSALHDKVGAGAVWVRPFVDRDDVIGAWVGAFSTAQLIPPAMEQRRGPTLLRRRSEDGTFSVSAGAASLADGPAMASWAPGRLDIFARGEDNGLWHGIFDGASGGWRPFERLGGTILSGPAAVSWGPGRLDVFARGTDGQLWQKWKDGDPWRAWVPLGGVLTSSPAVASWGPGRLDVFARGTDHALWHQFFDRGWSGWRSLGGILTSAPTAVSWDGGRVDVFVRGADYALHQRTLTRTRGVDTWSAWNRLGGYLTSGPAVASWATGRLDVFARDRDAALSHLWYQGGWARDWEALGGTLASDPAAVAWGEGRLDICVAGVERRIWHKWHDGGFSEWEQRPTGLRVHA